MISEHIRKAKEKDFFRVAEIEIFNYRLNFYPIFKDDEFYFRELSVPQRAEELKKENGEIFVFDDGVIKGFVLTEGEEIRKLFVEPVLQGNSIGKKLFDFAVSEKNCRFLWALEKNERAVAFYKRNGFSLSGERKFEEGTEEYLVKMVR